MSRAERIFRYRTGEIVEEGDFVKTGNDNNGVVVAVIAPGTTDAKSYGCPDGGILIKEDWDGSESLMVMLPPDGEYWEDLDFQRRK